ncbi:hypothetical protein OF122_13305 [Pelagibacterium flavum]|uniref:Uncharacterized protein n=1 Tax=Pelagibacterium flavum TaxID=2984530 RepID=A0ABY6INL7_9HYPH|nr:hypothetical protein [Pelagibacterium sp. YIM 151497]UYQ71034.1 hypothetical protein OF122_13305 [Pelagibacterium sp. YIM 151497]
MGTMHSYAFRLAALVLVAALAFGAIAALAIVRLQYLGQSGAEPLVTEIAAAEQSVNLIAEEPAISEPEPEPETGSEPKPEPAPEPEPEPIVADIAAAPQPAEPAAQTTQSSMTEELFQQSFVSVAIEPEPEPEPETEAEPESSVAASGLPIWLDLPDMTPTLEGLQTEALEVALADAPDEVPDQPASTTAALSPPEPEIASAPDENCDTASPNWAMFLFDSTTLGGWGRVPNVRVVPMGFCADTRQVLEGQMQADGRLRALRSAAAGDQLVSLALQRAARGPEDVFAVAADGSVLNVYVY